MFGRTGRFVLAGAVAAAAGSGAAVAIPASASSTASVSVLTLPSPSADPVQAIAASPSGLDADSVLISNGAFDQLASSGSLSSQSVSGTAIGESNGAPDLINDGTTDYLDDGTHLLGLSVASGQVNSSIVASTAGIDQEGIAVGPDSRIYVVDNGGNIDGCNVGTASCSQYAVPVGFGGGAPDGLVSAGGSLWFTDDIGDLGSMSTGGAFSSVEDAQDFSNGAEAIASLGGNLWLVSRNDANVIDEVPASDPSTITPYTVSGMVTPDITSLAVGPDGNIWFTDIANESVGFLNTTTHAVSEYAVPAGDEIYGYIAPGPVGTGTLVVPLSSGGDFNLLGQITSPDYSTTTTTTTSTGTTTTSTSSTPGTTSSTPGSTSVGTAKLGLTATASVSSKRVAAVKLSCSGGSGAVCAGRLTLTAKVKTKVKEKAKGKVKTVTKTKTVALVSGSYDIDGGKSQTLDLTLSAADAKLIESAKGEKLKVTATAKATSGTALTDTLTLIGPRTSAKRK